MTVSIDLTGRRALVTGGGSGIGLACARLLAEARAEVIVVDRNGSAARSAVEAIRDAGGRAVAESADTTRREDCGRLAERYPNVDVLVTCAASWTLGPFAEIDPDEWDSDVATTLLGTMRITWAFLPGMRVRGGSIVTIGSDAGRIGEPGQVAYSAAKGGVVAFTKALAREVGRYGIRVNCVSPALTRTPAAQSFIDTMDPRVVRRLYPLGRIGEPEDIANLVLFLASPRSGWITGQVISVNGGYTTAG